MTVRVAPGLVAETAHGMPWQGSGVGVLIGCRLSVLEISCCRRISTKEVCRFTDGGGVLC